MSKDDQHSLFGDLPPLRPLSRIEQRLVRSSVEIEAEDPDTILFQHTVFCQTGLPYRDPGAGTTTWDRRQGLVSLRVRSGEIEDDQTRTWRPAGLPFGPKPRLILAYLNAEALRTGSPDIEVDQSLTAFVKRIGLDPKGRNMRIIKDQLARLSAAEIKLSIRYAPEHRRQIQAHIVSGFDLWFSKDERQKVMWPSSVSLSLDYFESLQNHAVPLDERAIAALSHNAMGLDLYAWLAQRLYRVDPSKPAFIAWAAVKDQFGQGYSRMAEFKRVFRRTLGTVLSQYRGAAIELDGRGLTLRHSPPPIKGRMAIIPKV